MDMEAPTGKEIEGLLGELSEEKRIEELIKRAAEEWRATFDAAKELIIMIGSDFTIKRVNRPTIRFFDVRFNDILGRPYEKIFRKMGLPEDLLVCEQVRNTRRHVELEVFVPGRGIWFLASADPIFTKSREFTGLVFILREITELKKAEQERNEMQSQLLQVQKMDSIGRLAGGVAHDFNNMLSAILAYSEFAHDLVPEDHVARKHLQIVLSAAEKAAALTRQLLAFSRKQLLEKKVMNLSTTVENMGKMLGRIIREDIKLEIRSPEGLHNVLADPGQIEQIIMNLTVNARDSMPEGGTLIIETFDFSLSEGMYPPVKGMPPGAYSCLSVSDTGSGIPQEIREKIFEPFFTTKEKGKGTGLGLSTVYGIVTQHTGFIGIESEPGWGTRFTIYLPSTDQAAESMLSAEKMAALGGEETILAVDDDEDVRRLLGDALRPLGYSLITASGAEEALMLIDSKGLTVDLLLAEVMMSEMGGRKLAETFRKRWPDTRILLMSGFSNEELEAYLSREPSVRFVEKPLTPAKLARAVRDALDGKEQEK